MEGVVYVRFIIDNTGVAADFNIARSSGWKLLDNAAVQHLQGMPQWEPGYQQGKPVNVQYIVPIKFTLTGPEPKKKKKKG